MSRKDFHRLNGLFLLIFITFHMLTHLSGLWGIETYHATQNFFRHIYRNPIIEPILLTSFGLQIIIGINLVANGFRRKMAQTWPRIQAISALLFLYFITQHLIALIYTRWIAGLDTNFYWPASVMNGAPFVWFFAPYYFIGATALFVHVACFARLALLRKNRKHAAMNCFWLISIIGAIIGLLIVAIFLGCFYDIALPAEWIEYLRSFLPNYQPSS